MTFASTMKKAKSYLENTYVCSRRKFYVSTCVFLLCDLRLLCLQTRVLLSVPKKFQALKCGDADAFGPGTHVYMYGSSSSYLAALQFQHTSHVYPLLN